MPIIYPYHNKKKIARKEVEPNSEETGEEELSLIERDKLRNGDSPTALEQYTKENTPKNRRSQYGIPYPVPVGCPIGCGSSIAAPIVVGLLCGLGMSVAYNNVAPSMVSPEYYNSGMWVFVICAGLVGAVLTYAIRSIIK